MLTPHLGLRLFYFFLMTIFVGGLVLTSPSALSQAPQQQIKVQVKRKDQYKADYQKICREGKCEDKGDSSTGLAEGFVGVLQLVQECIDRCGRWDTGTTSCQDDTHAIRQGGQCVCDVSEYYVQARRSPTTVANGIPRCVKEVEGIRLKVKTADFEDAGTDAGFILAICPTMPPYTVPPESPFHFFSNPECYKCKFNDSGDLALNKGDFETIDLRAAPEDNGCEAMSSGRSFFPYLQYPDDVKYFAIHPDRNYYEGPAPWYEDSANYIPFYQLSELWTDDPDRGFDAWLIAGVELQVKLRGSSDYLTVHRNPVANTWAEITLDGGDGTHTFSAHSVTDDGYAFYIETGDCDDCGTDDTIFIRMPIIESLSPATRHLVNYYAGTGGAPSFESPGGETIDMLLDWKGYDDRERNEKTSYGATLRFGNSSLEKEYKICTRGSNNWNVRRIRAYYFQPGTRPFIDSQECLFDEATPNANLSTDSDEGTTCWPAAGYRSFSRSTNCPSFNTIEWGASYGFGIK